MLERSATEEQIARIRLIRSENIGPVTYFQLLARFGSATAALAAIPDLAARGGGRAPRLASRASIGRAMAAATQSRYIFLTDDSGIGNPHAPPAVDCYLVTRIDALVRRVLNGQISGRRVEPR